MRNEIKSALIVTLWGLGVLGCMYLGFVLSTLLWNPVSWPDDVRLHASVLGGVCAFTVVSLVAILLSPGGIHGE